MFADRNESELFPELDSNSDPFKPDPPAKHQVNGCKSASPEMFDLSHLAPPLSALPIRVCRTPEAFLGPTGASLVNLETLIPSKLPMKTQNNPFLSGITLILCYSPSYCWHVVNFMFTFTKICPLRSECTVSQQPLPLRPTAAHPQPDATLIHVSAAPSHAALQPVTAPPSAPPAARPPLLPHTASLWAPGPPL